MEFEDAVRRCVGAMGPDVVRDSRRFVSCLLDYADDSLALRAAARNLDDAALAPLAEALGAGGGDSLTLATAKVEMILRNERGLNEAIAHDIASTVGAALADSSASVRSNRQQAKPANKQASHPPSNDQAQSRGATYQPPVSNYVQPSEAPAEKVFTVLGHGFWWWYGVSWVLSLLGYVVTGLYGGSGTHLSIAGIDLSWFTGSPMFVTTAMTFWLVFVKLPVALYRHFRSKKT